MKAKLFLLVALVISIMCFISFAYADNYNDKNSSYLIASSGGFGNGGFGDFHFGGGLPRKTATPKPTATPTPKPLTEDIYEINRIAKSVFMLEVYDINKQLYSTGSGFLLFNNYTLVTNYHVIDQGAYIKAYSDEGYEYDLETIIAADPEKDIAILQFNSPTTASAIRMYKDQRVVRGERVIAIGSPLGIKNTITTGTITNITSKNNMVHYQFSAPISSGNSGGVLLNDEGAAIGITTSTLKSDINTIQNINYAVPLVYVEELYNNPSQVPISILAYFGYEQSHKEIISINILPNCDVQISWDKNAFTNATEYNVTISSEDELYHNEMVKSECFLEWPAIPDLNYRITVSNKMNNSETYSAEFFVKANMFPLKRHVAVDETRIAIVGYNDLSDTDGFIMTNMLPVTKNDLKQAMETYKVFGIYWSFYFGSSSVETSIATTIVIESPTKGYQKNTYDGTLRAFDNSEWVTDILDITELFQRAMKSASYESGEYKLKIYFDGYLAAQTTFTIY